MDYKKKIIDAKDVLMYEKIFYDARRGLEASHEHMKTVFGTEDTREMAKIILDEGEIQFTREYREQKRKEKWNRILDIIVRNAIDPRTGFPHPRTRIENAIAEAKVKIDDLKEAEDQVNGVVSALKPIIPIKFSIKEIEIKIPTVHAGKGYSVVQRFSKIMSDRWLSDGSWECLVELPAGLQNEFYDALNKLTHGDFESRVVRERS